MNNSTSTLPVVVVGAGIVGLSVALRLAMEGFAVSVIDPDDPMQGCSYGNAGYLTQSNIFPPLSTSILKSLPSLLLDPKSPLVVRMSYLQSFVPWALRAFREVPAARSNVIQDELSSISRRAIADFAPLVEAAGARDLISQEGSLVVYRTVAGLQTARRNVETWKAKGIEARIVDAGVIQDMEPTLANGLVGAIHFPNAGRCLDPEALGLRYADHLRNRGVRLIKGEVSNIRDIPEGVSVETDSGAIQGSRAIVCAGYFSRRLLGRLGANVPLASERGYHYMLPTPGVRLNRPVVFGEPHFAATPMREGLRLAGTAEFSAPQAPPRMSRARQLYRLASAYIPGLRDTDAQSWMGVRPSLPDGKPAIGRLRNHPNVFYAFGHGHNGLTYSATTAQYILDAMVSNEAPAWSKSFSLERF